jgi:hypothetical protein
MTFIAAATVASSLIGAYSSNRAAKTQADAARQAADLQYQQFRESVELQEPWRQAGMTALNKLTPLATEYTPFGMAQFQQDPGYQFRLTEGLKALDRQAAARGGLISGGALKAAQRYGQEMASGEYTNAFNRYQAERQARLGPLQSLAGVGQTTAQQLAAQGQQMASNVGNLQTSGAAARASGYVGGANALTGGLGTYLNYTQGQNLLNAIQGQRAGAPITASVGYDTGNLPSNYLQYNPY